MTENNTNNNKYNTNNTIIFLVQYIISTLPIVCVKNTQK